MIALIRNLVKNLTRGEGNGYAKTKIFTPEALRSPTLPQTRAKKQAEKPELNNIT